MRSRVDDTEHYIWDPSHRLGFDADHSHSLHTQNNCAFFANLDSYSILMDDILVPNPSLDSLADRVPHDSHRMDFLSLEDSDNLHYTGNVRLSLSPDSEFCSVDNLTFLCWSSETSPPTICLEAFSVSPEIEYNNF